MRFVSTDLDGKFGASYAVRVSSSLFVVCCLLTRVCVCVCVRSSKQKTNAPTSLRRLKN